MKSATQGKVLFLTAGFVAGVAAAAAFMYLFPFNPPDLPVRNELHDGQFELVNPLIDCPMFPSGNAPLKAKLQAEINEIIGRAQAGGKVAEVAVFFRDLNNGPTFSIGAKRHFMAASLLKMPVLISYFRRLSSDPGLLDRDLTYIPSANLSPAWRQSLDHPEPLVAGNSYKVGFLLNRMIEDSDNPAAHTLLGDMKEGEFQDVLQNMGVPFKMEDGEVLVAVEDYAAFFRILYNATYLGKINSNSVLRILSRSKFKAGLVAGVEPGVTVAHKYGERNLEMNLQFHDCGIVYYPPRPYLLCVMTQGTEQDDLIKVVADISSAAFKNIKGGGD